MIEGQDVLEDPEGTLRALCRACAIPSIPRCCPGPPDGAPSDGVWAPAWYDAVERSTGFAPPRKEAGYDDLAMR